MKKRLYVYVLYDRSRPTLAGMRLGGNGKTIHLDLYHKGVDTLYQTVHTNLTNLAKTVTAAICSDCQVVTSDFKALLDATEREFLPLSQARYDIYDTCLQSQINLPAGQPGRAAGRVLIERMLDRMQEHPVLLWQKVLANAAVVYRDIQDRGILYGENLLEHPQWSQQTFSGRSKTSGINVHGAVAADRIANPLGTENDSFILFDWVAADMSAAAALSGDLELRRAFRESDPYQHMAQAINGVAGDDGGRGFSRGDCKQLLLESVNALATDNKAIGRIYPGLWAWLSTCKGNLDRDGYIESLLGRRFDRSTAKNDRAVLNGVMQGTVAHAMQASVRRVWEAIGRRLLSEVHDSIVVTSAPNEHDINQTIAKVAKIMVRPLREILPADPFFTLRVSVGRAYKDWTPRFLFREGDDGRTKMCKITAEEGTQGEQGAQGEVEVES